MLSDFWIFAFSVLSPVSPRFLLFLQILSVLCLFSLLLWFSVFFTYSTLLSYSVHFLRSFHSLLIFSVFCVLSSFSCFSLLPTISLLTHDSLQFFRCYFYLLPLSVFVFSLFLTIFFFLSFSPLFFFICVLASLWCLSCFLRSDLYLFTVFLLCILFHTWISLSSMDADGQFHWNHRSVVKIRNRQERRKSGNQSLRKCHCGWVGVKSVSDFDCKEQAPPHLALCARGGRVACAELLAVALGWAEHRVSEWVPVPFLQEEDSEQTGEFVLTM